MAIYHLHAQVISRSKGRSSVAACAYRLGVALHDDRTGQTFDYSRKAVSAGFTLTPAHAPTWAKNPAQLWNTVEAVEKRKDAQLCREIDVALPRELTPAQQQELALEFCQDQFVTAGMCVTIGLHNLGGDNPHFHAMMTLREIGPDGFSATKNRDWNKVEVLEQWRESWAVHANRALERVQSQERIDHRSHEARGIDATPTRHIGPKAWAIEMAGRVSTRARELAHGLHDMNLGEQVRQVFQVIEERARASAVKAVDAFRERLEQRNVTRQPPPVPNLHEVIASRSSRGFGPSRGRGGFSY